MSITKVLAVSFLGAAAMGGLPAPEPGRYAVCNLVDCTCVARTNAQDAACVCASCAIVTQPIPAPPDTVPDAGHAPDAGK